MTRQQARAPPAPALAPPGACLPPSPAPARAPGVSARASNGRCGSRHRPNPAAARPADCARPRARPPPQESINEVSSLYYKQLTPKGVHCDQLGALLLVSRLTECRLRGPHGHVGAVRQRRASNLDVTLGRGGRHHDGRQSRRRRRSRLLRELVEARRRRRDGG